MHRNQHKRQQELAGSLIGHSAHYLCALCSALFACVVRVSLLFLQLRSTFSHVSEFQYDLCTVSVWCRQDPFIYARRPRH
ncbi:hypothetical protein BDR03DRAFT_954586 [Suillus americanus]|nr:hypothetical protein BDR03DRAFT_954586 [Suillus americanus]